MSENEPTLVLRGETKYLEQRVERVRATGFIDDVYTSVVELGEKTITKTHIRIFDILTSKDMHIAERLFHYGVSFRDLRWKRNSKIEFDGTVYKLDKCKGKNDQKLGRKELWEIRNPRNVELIEFETNKTYRATSKTRHDSTRRPEKAKLRRRAIKALEKKQREDLEQKASPTF